MVMVIYSNLQERIFQVSNGSIRLGTVLCCHNILQSHCPDIRRVVYNLLLMVILHILDHVGMGLYKDEIVVSFFIMGRKHTLI